MVRYISTIFKEEEDTKVATLTHKLTYEEKRLFGEAKTSGQGKGRRNKGDIILVSLTIRGRGSPPSQQTVDIG